MIREREWECFAAYHDELAAGVVVDYPLRNDCPVQVAGRAGVGPDPRVRVWCPVSYSIEPSGCGRRQISRKRSRTILFPESYLASDSFRENQWLALDIQHCGSKASLTASDGHRHSTMPHFCTNWNGNDHFKKRSTGLTRREMG